MLVAVALGLLGPSALASDEERENRVVRDAGEADADEQMEEAVAEALADNDEAPYWTRLTIEGDEPDSSVSTDDWDRAEAEFEKARLIVTE